MDGRESAGSFFAPRVPVTLVVIGDTGEGLLLRAILESLGASVLMHHIGTPEDFIRVMSMPDGAPYWVISAHGHEEGLVFGDYGPGVTQVALRKGCLPWAALRGKMKGAGACVFSTACFGNHAVARGVFLEAGFSPYISAADEPEGADIPLAAHLFFHAVLVRRMPLHQAVDAANGPFHEPMLRLTRPENQ